VMMQPTGRNLQNGQRLTDRQLLATGVPTSELKTGETNKEKDDSQPSKSSNILAVCILSITSSYLAFPSLFSSFSTQTSQTFIEPESHPSFTQTFNKSTSISTEVQSVQHQFLSDSSNTTWPWNLEPPDLRQAKSEGTPTLYVGMHHKTGTDLALNIFWHGCYTRKSVLRKKSCWFIFDEHGDWPSEHKDVVFHWTWRPQWVKKQMFGHSNDQFLHFVREPYSILQSAYNFHKKGQENEKNDGYHGVQSAKNLRCFGCIGEDHELYDHALQEYVDTLIYKENHHSDILNEIPVETDRYIS